MDKKTAIAISETCDTAIREIESILYMDGVQTGCSPEENDLIRRGIGLSIGTIDTQLACIVYRQFPDLDPIKDVK
jgi:hypothetical protein